MLHYSNLPLPEHLQRFYPLHCRQILHQPWQTYLFLIILRELHSGIIHGGYLAQIVLQVFLVLILDLLRQPRIRYLLRARMIVSLKAGEAMLRLPQRILVRLFSNHTVNILNHLVIRSRRGFSETIATPLKYNLGVF